MALTLTGQVDCGSCGTTYDGEWVVPDADTPEDLDGAPVQPQLCPECGLPQDEEWPGWVYFTEAG